MSEYYLEREKKYCVKILFAGFILAGSFLLAYFLKIGHLNIEDNFKKFIPVLLLTWVIVTFFPRNL